LAYRIALMSAPLPVTLRESGRTSVVALLSSYDTGQLQSCGYIRSYLPLTHGQLNRAVRLTVTSPATALAVSSDVLLVQRTSVSSVELAEQLVRHCRRADIRIVYETDDDLFQIGETHTESDFYSARIAPAELIARHASMILVSSPFLKRRLAHLNSDIRVIPNALDESLWFKPATRGALKPLRRLSNVVRILYMGTMTHSKDLDLIEEPIRMLKAEFGSSLEFDIIGITADQRQSDWFNVITVPGICGASYPLFVDWLLKENRWDFGVAPLVDNEFNRCKSFIKYLDYGALGIPGVFSAIGVFEGVVRHGVTGLCAGDETSWYEAMRLMVTNGKLRRQMGEAAYLDVETNHTLGSHAAMYRDLWDQIGNLPLVRSSSTIVSFSDETAAISSKGI
jgi:glycosyltransferase involved in cell wall biosynthesis